MTIGGEVGSLTLLTFLLGGETLQSLPHGGGDSVDGEALVMFYFILMKNFWLKIYFGKINLRSSL